MTEGQRAMALAMVSPKPKKNEAPAVKRQFHRLEKGKGHMTIRDTHAHHRQQRYAIAKPVNVATDGQTHKGGIVDISASGAAIRLDVQLEDGTRVDLLIKDMGRIAAQLARKFADGVAVEFDTDPAKEAAFLDALAQAIDAARRETGPAAPVT